MTIESKRYLVTLDTTRSKLLLVAGGAVDLLLPRDEALGPDGTLAHTAAETFLVPLTSFILHFLSS